VEGKDQFLLRRNGLNAGNQRVREREDQKGVGVRERISTVNVDLSGTNEEERGKLGLHMAFSVQYHL
jgi:hypothetical protein